jgi:hypothetical protein
MKLCRNISKEYNRKQDLGFIKAIVFWYVTSYILFIVETRSDLK